jgi:hypothetical protein
MKKSRLFFGVILLFSLILTGLLWVSRPRLTPVGARVETAKPHEPSKVQDESKEAPPLPPESPESRAQLDATFGNAFLEVFTTPISFYGQVVDDAGKAISGASIKLMVADKPWGKSSVYEQLSDNQGFFSLTGARGAGLAVDISKQGYYSTAKARGRFVYGGVRSRDDPANPTTQSPAIFVLRKMGETEPLLAIDRDVMIPKNGQPVEISLRTGRSVGAGRGDIVVECWTNNSGLDPNKNEPYDWRMRLSVPGGGLIERVGEFSFVAPESGYHSAREVNQAKSAEEWKSTTQGEYFIKTREGTFARLNVTMTTGGGHFVTIKSYLNPKAGSRNLEFDPAKGIKPTP